MLDAVQDHAFFVTEDDVAVLAHQLHDQTPVSYTHLDVYKRQALLG